MKMRSKYLRASSSSSSSLHPRRCAQARPLNLNGMNRIAVYRRMKPVSWGSAMFRWLSRINRNSVLPVPIGQTMKIGPLSEAGARDGSGPKVMRAANLDDRDVGHDQERRQYEREGDRGGAARARLEVAEPHRGLGSERAGHHLADRQTLLELVLGEPLAVLDE